MRINTLMKGSKEDGAKLISVLSSERTRGNEHKYKIKFHFQKKKIFSILRVVKHWNRLHRGAVQPTSLEVLRTHLKEVLAALPCLTPLGVVGLE